MHSLGNRKGYPFKKNVKSMHIDIIVKFVTKIVIRYTCTLTGRHPISLPTTLTRLIYSERRGLLRLHLTENPEWSILKMFGL